VARNKLFHRKRRYGRKQTENSSVPTWVVMKTNRHFRTKTNPRHWRRNTIKR
jgi:ribosomal protein L39E